MSHIHTMKDTDPSFYIDADLRTIESLSEDPVTLVKGDHNSEIFTFEMDRYIDEHDLKQCNKVEIHYINIDANNSKNKNYGIYTVTDLTVDPSDNNSISFTWKVPITATTYAGALSFVVRFECTKGEEILYAWNTTPCNEVSVLDSIYNTDFIEEEYTDVIGEWYNEILSAKNQAIDEIGKSGGIVVSRTEPDSDDVNVWVDNSEDEVVMLLEASDCVKMANSIKGNASGEVIILDDVSPLEHAVKAKVRGKNMLNPNGENSTRNGVTFTNNGDGTFSVQGTSTIATTFELTDVSENPIYLEKGKTYTQYVEITSGEGATSHIVPSVIDEFGTVTYNYFNGNQSKIPDKTYRINAYSFYMGTNVTVDFTFRVQLEEGDGTAYEPYVDPTTVTVTACGKNLFDTTKYVTRSTTVNGITVDLLDDGLIRVHGTPIDSTNVTSITMTHYKEVDIFPKGTYVYSNNASVQNDNVLCFPQANRPDNGAWIINFLNEGTYVPEEFCVNRFVVHIKAGVTSAISVTYRMQLECGDTSSDYEPYKEAKTYTPTSDGSVNIDSVSPNMTVFTDKPGVTIELEYNKDINKVLANLPSGGGGGGDITVDNALSTTSTNPVQNKVITEKINTISEELQDICIGADGTTYSSPGEAVRKQLDFIEKVFNEENIYDEKTNSTLSGTEYKIATVYLNGTEGFVTISTKNANASYIKDILLYDEHDTQITDVTISSNFYNVDLNRQGKRVTIPENARKLTFKYRFLQASTKTTLCSEMMVSIGKTVPQYYSEYEYLNTIKDSPYLTEKDINRVYYVSTTGDDNNDGFTKETALASVKKALEFGAKEIAIEAGEYFSDITLRNLNNIHIYTYRNNEEYSHTSPVRKMAKFIGVTYYNGYTVNDDGIYQQENVKGGVCYSEVFINKTMEPVVNGMNRANFAVVNDISNEHHYLKIVLTYEECVNTENSFYWNGATLFFNTAVSDFTKIAVITKTSSITILSCDTVTLDDICCEFTNGAIIDIDKSNNIILNNCQANYSATGMGFSIDNTNAILNNCYATKNAIDGFNFHGYGTTILNDCVAENNYDDGCSHHNGCIGTINGGKFSGSGKAGIAPAYGANVNIYNVVCENNPIGIGYLTTNNGHANMRGIVAGCLLKNNTVGLQVESLATVTTICCEYVENETDKNILS